MSLQHSSLWCQTSTWTLIHLPNRSMKWEISIFKFWEVKGEKRKQTLASFLWDFRFLQYFLLLKTFAVAASDTGNVKSSAMEFEGIGFVCTLQLDLKCPLQVTWYQRRGKYSATFSSPNYNISLFLGSHHSFSAFYLL